MIPHLESLEIDHAHSNGGYTTTSDFTSQARDSESGLMYYYPRFYDPSLGRYLMSDTIIPICTDAQK